MSNPTLKELARKVDLTFTHGATLTVAERDEQSDWQCNANSYRCTLNYQGRRYSFNYWQGIGIKDGPTAEGCLDSLLSDADAAGETFGEFCGNMGYDEDSRTAERIYTACRKEGVSLKRLLGGDYETFRDAERD
jgi:hypothetical protein